MKHIIKIFVFAILLSALGTSCTKYPDGPKLSLLTKKSRISGDWLIDQVTFNGADITAATQAGLGANYKFIINKNGTYSVQGAVPDNGNWKFGEDKDDAYFTSGTPGSIEVAYRILKLESKAIWFKNTAPNGDVMIIHYKHEKD